MMFILTLALTILLYEVHGKVTITKLELCDPKFDYPLKFNMKLKTENDIQVVEEGSLTSRVDMGDNIVTSVDAYSLEDGKYTFLIKLEDTWCNIMNKFMGDFALDMQKKAGITPGTCPVPKGEYNIANHPLDFQKFKYKDVPDGQLRLKIRLHEATTNETISCIDFDFTLKK